MNRVKASIARRSAGSTKRCLKGKVDPVVIQMLAGNEFEISRSVIFAVRTRVVAMVRQGPVREQRQWWLRCGVRMWP
jgi:hypothetical protein